MSYDEYKKKLFIIFSVARLCIFIIYTSITLYDNRIIVLRLV